MGWFAAAGFNDIYQWIQVDLGVSRLVSGVVTQGRQDHPQWMSKYKVMYSSDVYAWYYVRDTFYGQDDIVSYTSFIFYSSSLYILHYKTL